MSANKDTLILSIETATRAGSVAISRGRDILAARAGNAEVSHSATLLDDVAQVLAEASVTLSDVEVFAVACGPGSFTGLRIGLATVKSFAATLKRMCVGVPTLHAVAHAAGESARTLALLPAGRGEVFAQSLMVGQSGEVTALEAPAHLSPEELLYKMRGIRNIKWAGEGAHAHVDLIRAAALSEGILFVDETEEGNNERDYADTWMLAPLMKLLAVDVAALASLRVRASEVIPPQQLQAIYVRASDAEIKEKSKNG